MRKLFLGMAVAAALLTTSARAETVNCTEITALPFVITVQGVYCFKSDKGSSVPNGSAIEIQTNNVTIDLNGFKLGGLGAGAGTLARGILAIDRKNITIRNGTIRGFSTGVRLDQTVTGTSSGHLVEDLLLDGNRFVGVEVQGSGHVIRNNRVVNTGGGVIIAAIGIRLVTASNTVVAGNVVSGTSETGEAAGILVDLSALIEVRDNTILDTRDAVTTSGIHILDSDDVTVIGNRLINAFAFGTIGVNASGSSSSVNCIDNTIARFLAPINGCDFIAGNHLVP